MGMNMNDIETLGVGYDKATIYATGARYRNNESPQQKQVILSV